MRLVAALVDGGGRVHVSLLARQVGLSRTLVHMHLPRLEPPGSCTGTWPDAAIAMAGILFITVVAAVANWQAFDRPYRHRQKGESRYRSLAERAVEAEERTAAKLDELVAESARCGNGRPSWNDS